MRIARIYGVSEAVIGLTLVAVGSSLPELATAIISVQRPGQRQVQLDLLYDYRNNLKQYPIWQSYFRSQQPPMLIAWGKNDPIFPGAGAEAYKRDIDEIDFHLLDTGHFALEEEAPFIIQKIRRFLYRVID